MAASCSTDWKNGLRSNYGLQSLFVNLALLMKSVLSLVKVSTACFTAWLYNTSIATHHKQINNYWWNNHFVQYLVVMYINTMIICNFLIPYLKDTVLCGASTASQPFLSPSRQQAHSQVISRHDICFRTSTHKHARLLYTIIRIPPSRNIRRPYPARN